ncbi:MAG: DUF87 domain-containing protein [Melioribacteraceae bacterium]|nr:DUF87 domain-containing protein [Melioribacteraceae bacterium]
MSKLKFYLTNRFILFILCVGIFLIVNYLFTGNYLPTTETKDIWFYSGLFMVLFSVLFIEPFYSSPKNVITNSIPLLLVYIAIQQSFKSEVLWWLSIGVILFLIIISILAMALSKTDESEDSTQNKISEKLKSVAVLLGQGKVIYSAVFLSVLFLYKIELINTISDTYYFVLVILWGCLLLINTKSIHSQFSIIEPNKSNNSIGEIFSVQSERMFLVKLFEDKKYIKKFDIVNFKYQMDDYADIVNKGFVFDTYNLNKQKWAKVLLLKKDKENSTKLKSNTVYKITSNESIVQLTQELKVESFVGVIIEGSKIGTIKFEYSKKTNDIQEGDLLELFVGETKIYYQVFGGITDSENLELKDEFGFIKGEAIQLGTWNNETLSFEKYGWIPQINTPIFTADTENIIVPEFDLPEYQLGVIPNTSLPSVINLDNAISHHTALIGVTGSGKSFLAKEIIEKLKIDTKVICIDFTGEWKKNLELTTLNKENLDGFLSSKDNEIGLVELPVVSNTVKVIQSTENFISLIFDKARAAFEADSPLKICLVLEEAHTIVPEGSFLGVNDWDSKAVVNKMGQVALQGRKYGVGLLVIAQRTANVSKTVLTQCNTIICFQAFDETSFTFLGNYIGKDLVQALPNLKQYHAIVTGKAIKSNIPMIVNLERETDD